jgi:hypothetical protein
MKFSSRWLALSLAAALVSLPAIGCGGGPPDGGGGATTAPAPGAAGAAPAAPAAPATGGAAEAPGGVDTDPGA